MVLLTPLDETVDTDEEWPEKPYIKYVGEGGEAMRASTSQIAKGVSSYTYRSLG